jgi:predicted phage baseplate assembly protein
MALEAVQLDTLTWDQMVTAIRTRIPANSQSQWTLHAPVDPGVTLLELFAWLLEQRIYWMNQIPDALIYATLGLLGVAPQRAKPAVTVIKLKDSQRAAGTFSVAVQGTVMRLGTVNPPLLFTLADSVTLLPLVEEETKPDMSVGLIVSGIDRTNDLQHGRPVSLIAPGASSAVIDVLLTLEELFPPATAGGLMALLIELESPEDIPPQWLAEPGASIAPPASLLWSYTSGSQGQTSAFDQTKTTDGTAGLRRSGIVQLPIPLDWQAEPSAVATTNPAYKIRLQIESAAYTFPPRLLRVAPNVALAQHSWMRTKQVNTKDWLALPGNVVPLAGTPGDSTLKEYPPLEDTVKIRVNEHDDQHPKGQEHDDWQRVSTLAFSDPSERVFVVDRSRSEITFGDGLTGRLPVLAHSNDYEIEITYAAGGGLAGNVGEYLDWEAIKTNGPGPAQQLAGRNLVKGDGGAESEILAEAQQRAAAALQERNRAITGPDYENLAITTPGSGFRRAHAALGYDPEFPCQTVPGVMSVFVVPYAPREKTDGAFDPHVFVAAPQPDPAALAAARIRLNAGRLIGSQILVLPPAYRSVWLEVDVAADGQLSSDFREEIALSLRDFLDPLVGGDNGDGWPFGDPLRPSALLRQAQNALGDAADVEKVWVRVSGMSVPGSCVDVPIGSHELPKLEQVHVRVQTRSAAAGGLR